jgi:CheY-like chemotaxis protein
VLDLMMPVMNGREVIEAMLQHKAPRAAVIVVTAAAETATADLDPAVVKLIIRKPFDVARVIEAARAFCADPDDPDLSYEWPKDAPHLAM